MPDLTALYCSANKIPKVFQQNILQRLRESLGDIPLVETYTTPEKASITNYYKDMIVALKKITTPYVACCEDDTLYPDDHFRYFRPPLDTFAYNFNRWNLYTWSEPPFFSLRQRKILATLIAPRELLIEALEDKFRVDPNGERITWWGEPGRTNHEKMLGIPQRKSVVFETYNPLVVFSHEDSFCYESNGKNKRASKIRALEIPFWGTAQETRRMYDFHPSPKLNV
jgi:hypothetical protein